MKTPETDSKGTDRRLLSRRTSLLAIVLGGLFSITRMKSARAEGEQKSGRPVAGRKDPLDGPDYVPIDVTPDQQLVQSGTPIDITVSFSPDLDPRYPVTIDLEFSPNTYVDDTEFTVTAPPVGKAQVRAAIKAGKHGCPTHGVGVGQTKEVQVRARIGRHYSKWVRFYIQGV